MKNKAFYYLTFSLFVLLSFIYVPFAFGQQGLNITTFPARQEFTIEPGETKGIAVAFHNKSLHPLLGKLGTVDFIVKGDNNSPIFLDKAEINTRYAAASWIKLPYTNISIPGQDRVIIYANVTAPEDALPGGHYASIYFETTPVSAPEGDQRVTVITQRINALIYITIPGDYEENAGISHLKANIFQEFGPVDTETRIVNNGDTHIQPQGEISIKNTLGKIIQTEKLEERNIFPKAISVFKNTLGSKWMIGRYKLIVNATYGENNSPLSTSKYVYIFPWKVVLVILLALAIILIIGKSIYKKTIQKEQRLEEEIEKEKKEIEELKQQINKRN